MFKRMDTCMSYEEEDTCRSLSIISQEGALDPVGWSRAEGEGGGGRRGGGGGGEKGLLRGAQVSVREGLTT
jgi:hypothetical protein